MPTSATRPPPTVPHHQADTAHQGTLAPSARARPPPLRARPLRSPPGRIRLATTMAATDPDQEQLFGSKYSHNVMFLCNHNSCRSQMAGGYITVHVPPMQLIDNPRPLVYVLAGFGMQAFASPARSITGRGADPPHTRTTKHGNNESQSTPSSSMLQLITI